MSTTTVMGRQNDLGRRIVDSDTGGGLKDATAYRSPDWFWDLVARVDVLLGDAEGAHVAATLSGETGEVVVITTSVIVVARITDFRAETEDRSTAKVGVRGVPVGLVRGISVNEVAPATDRGDWPTRLRVTMSIADAPDVVVFANLVGNRAGVELAATVRRLLGTSGAA